MAYENSVSFPKLKMEVENDENHKSDEATTARNTEIAPVVEAVSDEIFLSELNEPCWSVISFEKSEATDLTYDEATQKAQEFSTKGVSGLCIVTNEAAQRVKKKQ